MSHEASVTITGNVVAVDIPTLTPHGPKKMVWTVNTPGWEFTATGITIDNNNTNQFTDPTRFGNNQKFSWDNANRDRLQYKYTIWVQPVGQPTLGKNLDPYIQNGGINP